MQGPKISRKGTHPAGREPSFDFHLSIIRLIQTEIVSIQRFLTSDFGRLLELMPVFLFGIR